MGRLQGFVILLGRLGLCLCLGGAGPYPALAAVSKKQPIAAKWTRFEQTFRSSIDYPNPLQNATLRVVFTSPLGETSEVFAFWDGGKVWRVRFCPWQVGVWSYSTICSDSANRGLHARSGQFLCTAAGSLSRFDRHGPVRVARDGSRLQHADGTPFFWLADTTWDGPRVASQGDWMNYVRTRAAQQFTVIQWRAIGGTNADRQSRLSSSSMLSVNPAYFQRLETKMNELRRVGLLSAIVPFDGGISHLDDDQLALLGRYLIARWGTEPVAWLIEPDLGAPSTSAERWRRLGKLLFSAQEHGPVILMTDQEPSIWQQFRDQEWIDALSCPSRPDSFPQAAGKTASQSRPGIARPLRIASLPAENQPQSASETRISAQDIRRATYWNLCLEATCGITYAAHNVMQWNAAPASKDAKGSAWPEWQKSLFLPAAREMAHLARLVNSLEYWRLQARPKLVAVQPGDQDPKRWIAAAGSEAKDCTLVYVPEDRTLDLALEALPSSPNIIWFNPRTGDESPAAAVVGGNTCQFPTPEPGDWLLVIREGKEKP